jgi:hypothetical protein
MERGWSADHATVLRYRVMFWADDEERANPQFAVTVASGAEALEADVADVIAVRDWMEHKGYGCKAEMMGRDPRGSSRAPEEHSSPLAQPGLGRR